MNMFTLCHKCGSLVSFNQYFGAYICNKCKSRDDSYDKIRTDNFQKIVKLIALNGNNSEIVETLKINKQN